MKHIVIIIESWMSARRFSQCHFQGILNQSVECVLAHHRLKRDFKAGGADELETPIPIVIVKLAKLAMTLFQIVVVFPIDDHSHIVLARDPRLDGYLFGETIFVGGFLVVVAQG